MWVPIVEQELLTFLEHTSSPAQPLVFYVMFCRSMFVFLSFIFRPLYCLSFDGRLLITPWYLQIFLLHCVVCPSMDDFWLPVSIFKSFFYIVLPVLRWTTFDYPLVSSNLSFTLYCLSFFNGRLLITPWYLQTFLLHCIVCPSSMDDFWLPLTIFKPFYYIVSSVLLQWKTFYYPLVSSSLSITLYCLSFFNGRLLITP